MLTLEELRRKIENLGYRTGFETESNKLVIVSEGYQLLGTIDVTKEFEVNLNRHFERQCEGKKRHELIDYITQFVKTPLNARRPRRPKVD